MQADVFYVPVTARLDFALAAAALAKSGLHNEIIMAVLLGLVTDVDGKVDIMPVCHPFPHVIPSLVLLMHMAALL